MKKKAEIFGHFKFGDQWKRTAIGYYAKRFSDFPKE